jgi:hypothetical protein
MATQEERLVRLLSLVDVLEPLSEEDLRGLAGVLTDISCGRGGLHRPEKHDSGLCS